MLNFYIVRTWEDERDGLNFPEVHGTEGTINLQQIQTQRLVG